VPALPAGAKSVYTKFALRKSIDFPIVNVAAVITNEKGVVKSARICLNSVYATPLRVTAAEEALVGKTIDETTAEQAAEAALADSFALRKNSYKVQIAKTLVKRAILACAE